MDDWKLEKALKVFDDIERFLAAQRKIAAGFIAKANGTTFQNGPEKFPLNQKSFSMSQSGDVQESFSNR